LGMSPNCGTTSANSKRPQSDLPLGLFLACANDSLEK
jgi:hypothetical protein